MNKTAKQQPTNNHKSKWTQQDAASKTYPRLKRRHKKPKTIPTPVAHDVPSTYPHVMKGKRP